MPLKDISHRSKTKVGFAPWTFLIALILLLYLAARVRLYIDAEDKSLTTIMLNLRVFTQVDSVWLNYLGFLFPFAICMSILIYWMKVHIELPKLITLPISLILLGMSISFFILPLEFLVPGGVGINVVALFAVIGYDFYLLAMDQHSSLSTVSFVLGFLVGLASDIGSVPYASGILTFGGGGLLDADLILPLSLVFSISFARQIERIFTHKKVNDEIS